MNRQTFPFVGFPDAGVTGIAGNLILSGTTISQSGSTKFSIVSGSAQRLSQGLYALTLSQGFPTASPQHFDCNIYCSAVASSSYRLRAVALDVNGFGGRVPTITLELVSGSTPTRVDPAPAVDMMASYFGLFKNFKA